MVHATLIDFGFSLSARGQVERKDSVAVFSLDASGIDLDRHDHRPVESAREPLAPMHRRFLRKGDGFGSREAQRGENGKTTRGAEACG